MDTNKYWFSLKSHIYVEFQKEEILLYDTQEGAHIKIENQDVISLIKDVYEPKQLGVVEFSSEILSDLKLKNIIDSLVKSKMADLAVAQEGVPKPIRLIPILNLQSDIDRIKERITDEIYKSTLLGKNTLKYLFEINLWINNQCNIGCKYCNSYYKQFLSCTSQNNGTQELSIESIKKILEQIEYSSVYLINILGGNIYTYSKYDTLKEVLFPMVKANRVHFHTHYKNYKDDDFIDSSILNVIVDFPNDEQIIQNILSKSDNKEWKIHFIIKDEEEYESAEILISKYRLDKYSIHPFYSGKNLSFFEDNIFLDEEDIFSNTLSMREVFRNQKTNKNFFGKLYIRPDGSVKPSINTNENGNIQTNTISSIVNKELLENLAWRQVRNEFPCNDCLNKHICPPISNYETVLNKLNLCTIKSK